MLGIDVSEHQNGMSLVRAAAEGIQFVVVRTTDGTYRDRVYRSHIDDALNAGLRVMSYHYLRNPSEGTTVAEQVEASVDVMGDHRFPMWLDCETPAGLRLRHVREAKAEFEARGVTVAGVYTSARWWRWRMLGANTREFGALWLAAYGDDRVGTPDELYPGDNHPVWRTKVGGQTPTMWQFGSRGQVAGWEVDVNYARGLFSESQS